VTQKFWLREETKPNEFRRALSASSCQKLLAAGHQVVVEDWKDSIIDLEEYKKVGCEIKPAGSWVEAAADWIIVGLKALPKDIPAFKHRHIFFAHVYKEQDGWQDWLSKFAQGGGRILDLEYMLDTNKRRVCAFGYWAGYVGAALGAFFTYADKEGHKNLKEHKYFKDKTELLNFVRQVVNEKHGQAMIIGAKGRSGHGAYACLKELKWNITAWDKEETSVGGPFVEILKHDLFVNCVLATQKMPPFLNHDILKNKDFTLKMISDVSCDPDSQMNMVPLYDAATTLEEPLYQVKDVESPLFITAIDNLPSLLPKESSCDFSDQLEKYLIDYNENEGPLKVSLDYFNKAMSKIS
jgi:hypothetical protein